VTVAGPVWLSFDQFEGRKGERFLVSCSDGPPATLELVEATESSRPGGRGPEGQQRLQFALLFEGVGGPPLPQGIHGLEHAELGTVDLFLVPVGPGQYEAVFA
jgi:hypothetical protein